MTTNQKISLTKQLKNFRRLMINAKISATKKAKNTARKISVTKQDNNRLSRAYRSTDMMM